MGTRCEDDTMTGRKSENDLLGRGWASRAACVGKPAGWWFPDSYSDVAKVHRAVAICGDCVVRAQCLAYAMSDLSARDYGIWGGTTPSQREHLAGRTWWLVGGDSC